MRHASSQQLSGAIDSLNLQNSMDSLNSLDQSVSCTSIYQHSHSLSDDSLGHFLLSPLTPSASDPTFSDEFCSFRKLVPRPHAFIPGYRIVTIYKLQRERERREFLCSSGCMQLSALPATA